MCTNKYKSLSVENISLYLKVQLPEAAAELFCRYWIFQGGMQLGVQLSLNVFID